MQYTVTVSKKGLMTLPSKLRAKLSIEEGSKVKLIEHDGNIMLVPVVPLAELYGLGKEHSIALTQAISDLEREHDEEAQR